MKYPKSGVGRFAGTLLAVAALANMMSFLPQGRVMLTASAQSEDKNHIPEAQGRIAFASNRDGNFEIYIMDPDGGGQTRITENTAEDNSPAWSPDGQRLAFVSYRDGNAEIYVMNDDGSGQTRLTNNAADDLDPAWSPDGTRIAFTSGRNGADEVYVMNADGSAQTNLTNNVRDDDLEPTWSPNGQQLAFTSRRDGNTEIYVMNADGTNQRNFTNNAANDEEPTWSPMRITFTSNRDGNDEIYTMNGGDGTGQTRLTNNEAFDQDASRAFNNALTIAFVSTRDGNHEIYAALSDGSRQTRLTDNAEASDIDPAMQPLAATAGQGTIQFSAATYTGGEDTGSVVVTVTRTGDAAGTALIDVTTINGTASARTDFISVLMTLRFAPGETSKTINILITDDVFLENAETVNITLSGPVGATLGTPNSATLTITDNDTATATTNPIDTRDFFVRQQYRDFLNRDPDTPGFMFWTGEYDRRVNACSTITNAQQRAGCVIAARATLSLAFFLSQEFQQTGYVVYRTYDVAFARLGATRPARGQNVTTTAITYDEFIRDTQTIAREIIVNNMVDQTRLEANTVTFFTNFVQRADFVARFPVSQSATEYVNALFTSANITPTAAERQAALDAYAGGGTAGRAAALRNIATVNDQVYQREFNRAFVLLQYIGYLRRDPDIAGYNFWLNKLDAASTATRINPANVPNDPEAIGRVRRSEMIEAFIRSCEYQRRFGPPTTSPDDRPVSTACGG